MAIGTNPICFPVANSAMTKHVNGALRSIVPIVEAGHEVGFKVDGQGIGP